MANSCFVVINDAHNNGHGESIRLVSSLSVVAAIFVAVHTDGQRQAFIFSHAYWRIHPALNQSFISLAKPDSF